MEEAPRQKPSLWEEGQELSMTKSWGLERRGVYLSKWQQPNFSRSTVDMEERL